MCRRARWRRWRSPCHGRRSVHNRANGGTVAQLHLPGGHHFIAGTQALDHLDQGIAPDAGTNRRPPCLAIDDAINVRHLAVRNHRLFRNQQDVAAFLEDQAYADEHAGTQAPLAVGHLGAQRDRPATGLDQRVDRFEDGAEDLPRQRIARHLESLPGPELRQIRFGQAEIDLQRRDVLDVDQILPFLDVIADAHVANADDPRERCPQARAVELRLRQGQRRLLHLQRRFGVVERLLADEGAGEEILAALEVGLCQPESGSRLVHLGRLRRRIEGHQQRAPGDRRAVAKVDRGDSPGYFRAQDDRLVRAQRADRARLERQCCGLHARRLDTWRRRLPAGRPAGRPPRRRRGRRWLPTGGNWRAKAEVGEGAQPGEAGHGHCQNQHVLFPARHVDPHLPPSGQLGLMAQRAGSRRAAPRGTGSQPEAAGNTGLVPLCDKVGKPAVLPIPLRRRRC
ncbi:MAG: hypothetical protein AW07_03029 [Candidatus Accumulibacter sp. SK-11]|nr:MAG: hypothetical protein AW07_03029 [Candidatus Accumulibacter sp. SK-11]